ncbi:endonuclease-reverse transcriptase [Elysia marginata]|uniref:Endonuclease-reverse transcriptase n=1 Tax=Elysia marginata TaxID=1093978 RepID=A0AAV4JZC5_9GAST|nr:endonuclease-reverse transcriptase [Elysia marginata]
MLDRIVDKCIEYDMEIIAEKTKTMHIGRDTETLTITVGNAVFEQVQIRIEKARQEFWESKELLRRKVGLNTKKRILSCHTFSVLNHGCEAWTYSKTVQKKIKTFEMWGFRRLLKVPWTEKKTNKEIIQMADVGERRLQQLNKRRLRYADMP